MECARLFFSRHALERMFQRSVSPDMVRSIIVNDDRIFFYPSDKPYPSTLLLGFAKGEPFHVLVAREKDTGDCVVVTVYRPDPANWNDDFRTRRKP
jgi:hypothetical protein